MNRVAERFEELKKAKRCGVVAYVTCGDPDPAATVAIVEELVRSGADAIELGVPFSDPIADGPVIQAAAQRALQRGTTIADLFTIAKEIRRESEIPLVAFSYINPILRFGIARFGEEAQRAGIDSVLVTDLPPEAAGELRDEMRSRSLGTVFLVAPTSPPARVRLVDKMSEGFVYYVSTNGVTGARRELDPTLIDRLVAVRKSVRNPLAVGFGVSERAHYTALAAHCDAVVVGSAVVRAIYDGDVAGAPVRAGAVIRRILGNDVVEAGLSSQDSSTIAGGVQ